jgi:hypothetical protein
MLAAQMRGEPLQLWRLGPGKVPRSAPWGEAHATISLAFSTDGKALVTGTNYNSVHLWEVATGKKRRTLGVPFSPGTSRHCTWPVPLVALAPDGRTLAAVAEGRTVHLWETASGNRLGQFQAHRGRISAIAFSPDSRILATGGEDATVLLWDLARWGKARPPTPLPLTRQQLETCWKELGELEADHSYDAIWRLATDPRSTVPYLREHLRIPAVAAPQHIARLTSELDSGRFAVREKATRDLAELEEQAETALRKALEGQPTPEVRRRVEELLAKLNAPVPPPERLRIIRAVEVLEHIATPEARRLLEELSQKGPKSLLKREAREAAARLAVRSVAGR